MDLRKVNQMSLLAFKPTIPLRNLKIDEKYRILGIKKITGGKYGHSLIADLEEAQTFLPKRLIPNPIDHLEDFATGQYCLVNHGLKEFRGSNIRLFNNALLNCDTTPQLKSKLQTNIGHLRKYRQLLRCLNSDTYLGGALSKKRKPNQKRSDRIRSEDGKSAFSSRIRSGLIINVLHTDPIEFLKDSFYLFKPAILNMLKKFPTIKVNAVLCCEFIKETVDQAKHYLPYGGFKWVSEIENFDVLSIPNDSDIGYMLEVDLSYPENLHDSHKDLPLCPEHRTPPNSKLPKLMTTLHKKERYVVHYTNLKQYLECGMKLDKIHRILQFNQSPWLKVYVDLNARLRANYTKEFEKKTFLN
ncbi:hypothetical protein NQ315_011281 [Exocentrus adspersus]|uniref:Uncharacterized protein n=1 Tax=Exocentrus adspersus TaxID=1586481 RepID=A0AAV8VIX7_9CUCU|nr:hypothetical protein NQ315_011281 [Exocentrus adspersus]